MRKLVIQTRFPPIGNWGDTVRVVADAPEEMWPSQLCSVCGMRQKDGVNLYLVESSTGQSEEVPELLLESVSDQDRTTTK